VTDSFNARGNHTIRIHFHLDPACDVNRLIDNTVEITCADTVLVLGAEGASLTLITANEASKPGWISNGYHQRQPSTCIRLEQKINGHAEIETVVVLR
jgi:hypothetical protein